jgi:hypothetical protein
MNYYIRTQNEEGEIEFFRTNDGGLLIDITQAHGNTYHILTEQEVKCLIDYLKLTDEQL